jgi:replicative superfamily II helicase
VFALSLKTWGSDFAPGSIAICTYEKAHSLLNSAICNRYVSKIKLIVIDEVHMIGDESRGVVVESLIMKLRLLFPIPRIVALTATLSQADGVRLSQTIHGFCHFSATRPNVLTHNICCITNGSFQEIRDGQFIEIHRIKTIKEDTNYLIPLVRSIVSNLGATVLIFVNSRNETRAVARFLTKYLEVAIDGLPPLIPAPDDIMNQRDKLMRELRNVVSDVDQVFAAGLRKGIGFHHAGLLLDERRIVEHGIKSGALYVVIATTTLSAGVNIRNVRRVIIHSPYRTSGKTKTLISHALFAQMAGRSGREEEGGDVVTIIRNQSEIPEIHGLISQPLPMLDSSITKSDQIFSYILQALSLRLATDVHSLKSFLEASFALGTDDGEILDRLVKRAIDVLVDSGLVDGEGYNVTDLGNAISYANLSYDEGRELDQIVKRLLSSLCLIDDIHLLYLCSPFQPGIYLPSFREPIWDVIFETHMHAIHLITNRTTQELRRIVILSYRGETVLDEDLALTFLRIYTACILENVINEVPLTKIEKRFGIDRGTIQSLQTSATAYAGQVNRFIDGMGYYSLSAILSCFRKRLHFAVREDLIDLVKLPAVRKDAARLLYDSGIKTAADLSALTVDHLVLLLPRQLNPDGSTDEETMKRQAKQILAEANQLNESLTFLEEYEELATKNATEDKPLLN